jgi:uncharacterized protein (TIGR02147 family)
MNNKPALPRLVSYTDYRKYLHDYFCCMKKEKPYFSHRYFCTLAGFKTSGAIKLVIDNKRNLSRESIVKISTAIGHSREEYDFFETLVLANQATDPQQRRKLLLRLKKLKNELPVTLIDEAKHVFFNEWHHAVVREMIELPDFTGEPEWIAKRIWPKVDVVKINESFSLLAGLGLIKKDRHGTWRGSAQALTTEPELASEMVADFNRAMIRNAMLASHLLPRQQREISGTTLRISRTCYKEIKQRIVRFKRELLEAAIADVNSDRIYQLNIQFFPLMEEP